MSIIPARSHSYSVFKVAPTASAQKRENKYTSSALRETGLKYGSRKRRITMVRPVRILIVALSVALLLSAMQIDVSAKKKSSKRKIRKARSTPVFVMPAMSQREVVTVASSPNPRVPVIVRSPSLSEMKDEGVVNNAAAGQANSSSEAGAAGLGDSQGPKRQSWMERQRNIVTANGLIISE